MILLYRQDRKASEDRLEKVNNRLAEVLQADIVQRGQLIEILTDLRKQRFCIYEQDKAEKRS
jgi:hypothetical protein